ncbi:MAG: LapA family protein [Usitatibacter sp.]
MNVRLILILLVFAALGLLAAFNWNAFMAPTSLWLVFTTVQAPLGLIMLAMIALLSALFLAYVIYLQGSVLIEARRQTRELQAQRELAEKAEASRFTELKGAMLAELDKVAARMESSQALTAQRLDKLDHDFGDALEHTESSIAAYIGELDDRLGGRGKEAV